MQLGLDWATFLQVLATVKSPANKSWILALPIAYFSLETHSGDKRLLKLKKETGNIQTPTPKINNNPNKIQEISLQDYGSWFP